MLCLLAAFASAESTTPSQVVEPEGEAEGFVLAELSSRVSADPLFTQHRMNVRVPVLEWAGGGVLLGSTIGWGRWGERSLRWGGFNASVVQRAAWGGVLLAEGDLTRARVQDSVGSARLSGLAMAGWQGEQLGVGLGTGRSWWGGEWLAYPVLWVEWRPLPWLRLACVFPVSAEVELHGEHLGLRSHVRSQGRSLGAGESALELSWVDMGLGLWWQGDQPLRVTIEGGALRVVDGLTEAWVPWIGCRVGLVY
ncbi:MAG: hypothetical protein ACI9VR_001634 [Cognaticolwellia sp.]|jgi:hypothetical protein